MIKKITKQENITFSICMHSKTQLKNIKAKTKRTKRKTNSKIIEPLRNSLNDTKNKAKKSKDAENNTTINKPDITHFRKN